jgi:phosphonate transport system substrate-binding protein
MRLVADGTYDASAIDSHLLAVMRRRAPQLISSLRVIDSIGPSPIQPVVAADHVPADVRKAMADALTSMRGRSLLDAHVSRYERVTDADYDAIRAMAAAVADAGCFLA